MPKIQLLRSPSGVLAILGAFSPELAGPWPCYLETVAIRGGVATLIEKIVQDLQVLLALRFGPIGEPV